MDQANQGTEFASLTPEVVALLKRGMGGDWDLPELRRALDENPALVNRFGDVVHHIQVKLIALAEQNPLGAEALERKATQLRAELHATATTPIERLLADRVALCSLAVHVAELELLKLLKTEPGDAPTVRAADRRLNSAQGRFLAATKALATAQKLLRPAPSVLELLGGSSRARTNESGERRSEFNPESQGTPAAN